MEKTAGKEDPVELDSSLALFGDMPRCSISGSRGLRGARREARVVPRSTLKYHYSHRFLTYSVMRSACRLVSGRVATVNVRGTRTRFPRRRRRRTRVGVARALGPKGRARALVGSTRRRAVAVGEARSSASRRPSFIRGPSRPAVTIDSRST